MVERRRAGRDLLSKTERDARLPPGCGCCAFALLMAAVLRSTRSACARSRSARGEPPLVCAGAGQAHEDLESTVERSLAGLSGVMVFAPPHRRRPTVSSGLELNFIDAVVIGGASLAAAKGTILGSVSVRVMMSTLATGCDLPEIPKKSGRSSSA
jgi:hypothetical protein